MQHAGSAFADATVRRKVASPALGLPGSYHGINARPTSARGNGQPSAPTGSLACILTVCVITILVVWITRPARVIVDDPSATTVLLQPAGELTQQAEVTPTPIVDTSDEDARTPAKAEAARRKQPDEIPAAVITPAAATEPPAVDEPLPVQRSNLEQVASAVLAAAHLTPPSRTGAPTEKPAAAAAATEKPLSGLSADDAAPTKAPTHEQPAVRSKKRERRSAPSPDALPEVPPPHPSEFKHATPAEPAPIEPVPTDALDSTTMHKRHLDKEMAMAGEAEVEDLDNPKSAAATKIPAVPTPRTQARVKPSAPQHEKDAQRGKKAAVDINEPNAKPVLNRQRAVQPNDPRAKQAAANAQTSPQAGKKAPTEQAAAGTTVQQRMSDAAAAKAALDDAEASLFELEAEQEEDEDADDDEEEVDPRSARRAAEKRAQAKSKSSRRSKGRRRSSGKRRSGSSRRKKSKGKRAKAAPPAPPARQRSRHATTVTTSQRMPTSKQRAHHQAMTQGGQHEGDAPHEL